MSVVVVAASARSSGFAVVDFTRTPPATAMVPASAEGNVIDCHGTLAAVGDCGGVSSTVTLYDIANPAAPRRVGSVATGLPGLGSIAMDGGRVLAGEYSGSRVALIDVATPSTPALVSVFDCAPTLHIIFDVAIRGTNAVVSGADGYLVLDYANAASGPSAAPSASAGDNVLSDYDGANAAIGISGSAIQVHPVPASVPAGQAATVPCSRALSSVAVAPMPGGGCLVAAGAAGGFTVVAYAPDKPPAPVETALPPGQGTAVALLKDPARAPSLAVASTTDSAVSLAHYAIRMPTAGGAPLSVSSPGAAVRLALAGSIAPTLGIAAFTPRRRFFSIPLPGWLETIVRRIGG